MHSDELIVDEPCHADWDTMSGDDRKRFCGACQKHVHDLNALTRPEAETLLTRSDDLCVQFRPDPDGRISFRPSKRTMLLKALAAASVLVATPAFASGNAASPEGTLKKLSDWWYGVDTTVDVHAEPIEIIPEVASPQRPTSLIPELSTPIRPPVEVVVPPQPPAERMPQIRGKIAFHPRKPLAPQPPVEPLQK